MGFLGKILKSAQGIGSLETRYEPSTPYYTTMIAPMPTRLDYSEMPSGIASLGDQNTRNLMDMQRKSFSRFVPRQTSSLSNVGNTQTGGYGITLTEASTVIYYSNNYDLEKRLQSEDRAHRIGQKNKVTYIDIVCERTVDEKIVTALRRKQNIAQTVLGEDHWKNWLL